MGGALIICGTPIGNLEDVSMRLLRTLAEADVIAAEDTRRTRKLLTAHGVSNRLTSYHDRNEHTETDRLVGQMKAGKRIALVTDGGMPAISDPGFRLVDACIKAGIQIEVVPGPSALIVALAVSGLPTARFSFEGFLPRKAGERTRRLESIAKDDRTLIFFEAANRLNETLLSMREAFGSRRVAIARELTKAHEEVLRGTIGGLLEQLDGFELRGEVTLVVEGATRDEGTLGEAVERAIAMVRAGSSKTDAAKEVARTAGVDRRAVYEALIDQPAANGSQSAPPD